MARLTYPKFQSPDINGVNLAGGFVYCYEPGTSTPKDSYSDISFATPNANPVVLDARGEADIYLNGSYKIVLKTADDVEIWTEDPWSGYILADDLASTDTGKGSGLVGYVSDVTGAVARTVDDKLQEIVTPLDFMTAAQKADVLAGTGSIDVTTALQAAALHKNVTVPEGNYLVSGKTSLIEGQAWNMQNPTFTLAAAANVTIFEADDIYDWDMLGRCTAVGTLVTSADTGTEKGLVIKGSGRYTVMGFHSHNMRSHGIHKLIGGVVPSPRGDQGQFTDCASYICRTGLEIDPGSASEYDVFSNFNASGCIDGVISGGGNTVFMGGNVVDNTEGITLIAGSNHGHGSFNGTNINHNVSWNLKAVSVTLGYSFNGCHFYGNGSLTSPIWFENSKGININGGAIDCAIYNDGTTGINSIANAYIPTTTPTINGTNPEYLRMLRNWTEFGAWKHNDSATHYSHVQRATSTLAIPGGTTVIFNNRLDDKRSDYDTTTGLYTVPTDGDYRVDLVATITGTSFSANGYFEVKANTTIWGFIPSVVTSSTIQLANGVMVFNNLTAGDTIELVSRVTGTSPVLATTTSHVIIRGLK